MLSVDGRLQEIADRAVPRGRYELPYRAGPADYWLAVLLDTSASVDRRDAAARNLERLGQRAIDAAWRRRDDRECEALEAQLTPEELEAIVREPLTEDEREALEEELRPHERDRRLERAKQRF